MAILYTVQLQRHKIELFLTQYHCSIEFIERNSRFFENCHRVKDGDYEPCRKNFLQCVCSQNVQNIYSRSVYSHQTYTLQNVYATKRIPILKG
jgi:hypothetical protein